MFGAYYWIGFDKTTKYVAMCMYCNYYLCSIESNWKLGVHKVSIESLDAQAKICNNTGFT